MRTAGRTPEELRELVSHVGAELELAPAEHIIEWAVATFGDRFCITSSMVTRCSRTSPRRWHPGSTSCSRHRLPLRGDDRHPGRRRGHPRRQPDHDHAGAERRRAGRGARQGPLQDRPRPLLRCARSRRSRSSRGTTRATGLRRPRRTTASSRLVGWDAKKGKVKVSPLARWSDEQVERYIAENGVLVNPLVYDGYPPSAAGRAPAASPRARTPAAAAGQAPTRRSAGSTHEPSPADRQRRRSSPSPGTAQHRLEETH